VKTPDPERNARTTAKLQLSPGEKSHASRLAGSEVVNSLVGNGIRSVCQTCPNIVLGDPWIGVQDICRGRSLGKLTQEQFDWNACVANYRLAEHYRWIDFDSIRHAASTPRLYQTLAERPAPELSNPIGNRSREGSLSDCEDVVNRDCTADDL